MTPDIKLEPLNLAHTEALFQLTDANRQYLRQWLPWLDDIRSSADTRQFIEANIDQVAAGGAPSFAIIYDGDIVGVAGFHQINQLHRLGSIGYWLAENQTGKGIMTWSVARLLEIGFDDYGLNRIELRCAEANHKSRAIAERLGFTYEATLRQCEWLYTHYVDHVVYSILATEYAVKSA